MAVGIVLSGLLGSAATARAGLVPVAPGQSSLLAGSAYSTPAGTVVARESTPFVARYQPDGTFADFAGSATGQFDSQVQRDPKTGQLTFVYKIELNNEAFTSAPRDPNSASAALDRTRPTWPASFNSRLRPPCSGRRMVRAFAFFANSPGLGGIPELAVATNATLFDAKGAVTFSLADVFRVNGPHGTEMDNVWGSVTLKNAYRPIGAPADNGGSTAVAVPLPSAFYTGLGIMMACGVISLFRRLLGN